MKKLNKSLQLASYFLVWFLVLPFPFEGTQQLATAPYTTYFTQWRWFGGYHLFMAKFPVTSDGFRQESYISQGYYHSRLYPVVFVVICVLLAYLTYRLVNRFRKA